MFGISYLQLTIHLALNIALCLLAVICVGLENNFVMFYLFCLILSHCLITDLIPHRTHGWKKLLHIIIEESAPVVLVLFTLSILAKGPLSWKALILSLLLILVFSLLLKGIFCVFNSFFSVIISQIILGIISLLFLSGIFLAPLFMVLMKNYESKNDIYLFFAQINPLIVISNLFNTDPFHKDQLYQYFGSNYLVPKLDGINSLVILGIFALIFWMVYVFWGKEKVIVNG